MIPGNQVRGPCRAVARSNKRVQLQPVHQSIDALRAGQLAASCKRIEVDLAAERALAFGSDERVLTEERHFPGSVSLIELDDVLERADRSSREQRGQVCVQIVLELVEE